MPFIITFVLASNRVLRTGGKADKHRFPVEIEPVTRRLATWRLKPLQRVMDRGYVVLQMSFTCTIMAYG